jgi:hypothetical protein
VTHRFLRRGFFLKPLIGHGLIALTSIVPGWSRKLKTPILLLNRPNSFAPRLGSYVNYRLPLA